MEVIKQEYIRGIQNHEYEECIWGQGVWELGKDRNFYPSGEFR